MRRGGHPRARAEQGLCGHQGVLWPPLECKPCYNLPVYHKYDYSDDDDIALSRTIDKNICKPHFFFKTIWPAMMWIPLTAYRGQVRTIKVVQSVFQNLTLGHLCMDLIQMFIIFYWLAFSSSIKIWFILFSNALRSSFFKIRERYNSWKVAS